jgi:hypothetical protein
MDRTPDLDTLRFHVEQLTTAVEALSAPERTPQERLDRALSYFSRTYRDDPTGPAFAPWRRIYKAIGDPPIGTTIAVRLELLTEQEQTTISQSLTELLDHARKTCEEAEQTAALAAGAKDPNDPVS